MGGLSRKATYVKELAASGESYLVVDGGDLLFSKPQLNAEALAKEKIQAHALVEGYSRIGTDAFNIGDHDLAAGLPFLRALADSARFPFLSATLVDDAGETIFKPYTIVKRGDLTLGLVGASSQVDPGEDYHSLDLIPALNKVVREVIRQVDLVVVLFHGADEDKQEIMASGLPVHLILQSHVKRYDPDFGSGAIPAVALGRQGRYLNLITLNIRSIDQPLMDLTDPNRTLRFVENSRKRLRRNQPKNISLEEIYTNQPKILQRLEDLDRREAEAREIIENAVNTIESQRIALNNGVKDDEDILMLVNAAKEAIGQLSTSTVVSGPTPKSSPAVLDSRRASSSKGS